MNIDIAIKAFASFLNSSWTSVSQLLIDREYTSNEDSINDWLQANWELLVEKKVLKVNEYLEVYGDGADYNSSSSRITDLDALPNFKIVMKSKNGNNAFDLLNNKHVELENLDFEKLVGFENGFYVLEPVFKYVLVIDNDSGEESVISLENIEFELERL